MVVVVAVRTIFRLEWVELTAANILQCLHSLSAKHIYILYMLMLYISRSMVSTLVHKHFYLDTSSKLASCKQLTFSLLPGSILRICGNHLRLLLTFLQHRALQTYVIRHISLYSLFTPPKQGGGTATTSTSTMELWYQYQYQMRCLERGIFGCDSQSLVIMFVRLFVRK